MDLLHNLINAQFVGCGDSTHRCRASGINFSKYPLPIVRRDSPRGCPISRSRYKTSIDDNLLSAIKTSFRGKSMDERQILLENTDKIHSTPMGIERIRKNLGLDSPDAVRYCKSKISDKNCNIYKQGKNRYCETENIRITVNSYSYTIITAHIVK